MRSRLDFVSGQHLGDDKGVGRLHRDGKHILTLCIFQITANAGYSAPGTDHGDKNVYIAVSVLADFRVGGLLMNGRISRIADLLEHQEALEIGRDNFFLLGNGVFHPF